MKKLLDFKAWQILLLFLGLPVSLALAGALLNSSLNNSDVSFIFSFAAVEAATAFFFGWMWTIGVNLYRKADDKSLNVVFFKMFCLISFAIFFFALPMVKLIQLENMHFFTIAFRSMGVIFMLICIGFIAKCISIIKPSKKEMGYEVVKNFFLMLLFPIGVLFIQPTINQLFSHKD